METFPPGFVLPGLTCTLLMTGTLLTGACTVTKAEPLSSPLPSETVTLTVYEPATKGVVHVADEPLPRIVPPDTEYS